MKVYLCIECQDQTMCFREARVFSTKEKAESWCRNRRAFIEEVEVE